jgi:hypothetical protein
MSKTWPVSRQILAVVEMSNWFFGSRVTPSVDLNEILQYLVLQKIQSFLLYIDAFINISHQLQPDRGNFHRSIGFCGLDRCGTLFKEGLPAKISFETLSIVQKTRCKSLTESGSVMHRVTQRVSLVTHFDLVLKIVVSQVSTLELLLLNHIYSYPLNLRPGHSPV